MNKLTRLFAAKPNDLLALYFTAGYPALHDTPRILRALLDGAVDMIEVGFPFSDPLADGPVIQRSSETALRNGMSLAVLFEQLRGLESELRAAAKPVVLMGYFNPVLQYGVERFCAHAAAAGISACILPDLPMAEYLEQYRETFVRHGLAFVPLITPSTPEERIRFIDRNTDGFLYLVSSSATTGSGAGITADMTAQFERIRALNLRNPLLIGFGIHDRASFQAACRSASGAIIGTAFIQALSTGEEVEAAVPRFIRSVAELVYIAG